MSRRIIYRLCLLLLLWLPVAAIAKKTQSKDNVDWSISLDHDKKTPYGTSIAFETIPHYFPQARRETLTKWFRYSSIDHHMDGGYDSVALLVMLGLDYFVSGDEWKGVLNFAKDGNEVFLIASRYDLNVSKSFCEKSFGGGEEYPLSRYNDGSKANHVLKLMPDTSVSYGYTGRSIYSSFLLLKPADTLKVDSSKKEADYEDEGLKEINASIKKTPDVLGIAWSLPNFIRYKVGRGHVTLHASPLVFSNYFLLQPGNREYLDAIWHSFPANISVIYWNEYYKRSTESSSMSVLLKYPATRWALIIAALTLLLYVLFGLKRMQRIVPIVPPVENASVSFVETVGRLYFNKGQHANLAEKMVQHFLEWVRTSYHLDTTQLNEPFARQLAAKSGKSYEEVDLLIQRIHDLRLGSEITPEYLYDLYRSIQSFYKTR